LKHFAELGPKRLRGESGRFGQQLFNVGALQGNDTQLGENLLLADTLMQRTQGQVGSIARGTSLNNGRAAFIVGTHTDGLAGRRDHHNQLMRPSIANASWASGKCPRARRCIQGTWRCA